MPRRRKPPSYPPRPHASGLARIVLLGRHVYLGAWGSPESHAAYQRCLTEWRAAVARADSAGPAPDLAPRTVADLVAAFLDHAQTHYRHPDGTPTDELGAYRRTLDALLATHGQAPIEQFGPAALKAVRQAWIDRGLARKTINQRVNRVRHTFRWGVAEEYVPNDTYQRLKAVAGLQAGRTPARETAPVLAADPAHVEAVLPHLGPVTRAMVQLQRLTGMRPGEVCALRPCDLDRDSLRVGDTPVWVYRPAAHKTAHRGHARAVALGPQAQAVLAPFLAGRPPLTWVFSPREELAILRAERRARRTTPLWPSSLNRPRAAAPKRQPGARYSTGSYGARVRQACLTAGVPPWHPHQLRHAVATEVLHDYDLDHARAVLGQRDPKVTVRYAHADLAKAAAVAARIG